MLTPNSESPSLRLCKASDDDSKRKVVFLGSGRRLHLLPSVEPSVSEKIRYAQCWEDADILLRAAAVKPGANCLSIASGGDNSFALLAAGAARVVCVDTNPAQLALVELKIAAYACLTHSQMLEFLGVRPCAQDQRLHTYQSLRLELSKKARHFWDNNKHLIARGVNTSGRFEGYFNIFKSLVLPLVHSRNTVNQLLQPRTPAERKLFFDKTWNTAAWQTMFKVFFSRTVMALLGRSQQQFAYVEGKVAERIAKRVEHALTELEPDRNPYLHWILTGTFGEVLPFALREENFQTIKANLHRIELRHSTVERALKREKDSLDVLNLSDIFEYMSVEEHERHLELALVACRDRARLVYWNMLVPRHRPDVMGSRIRSLDLLSEHLYLTDRAFFYSDLVVEEIRRGDQ